LVVSPWVEPKVPAGQGMHAEAEAVLYCPTGQMFAVAEVDPAGQK